MQTSAHAANSAGALPVGRDALLAMEVDRPIDGQQLTALYVRRPYDTRPSLVFVDAGRLEQISTSATPQTSASGKQTHQQLVPAAIVIPNSSIGRRDCFEVVQVYAVGAGIAVERDRDDLQPREGALELEAHGNHYVVDPLKAVEAQWRVVSIESVVGASRLQIDAVEQIQLTKFGCCGGHESAPRKTAILTAPQGFGKSTIAHAMAAFIGCTHVVEEWDPATPAVLGALHLTSSPLPTQGWTDAAPKQPAYTADSADTELEILQRAEGFMLGFEGDATQPGVDDQLANLRYLIEQRRAKKGAGLLLELARRVARLNPDAGEIGAGMLASLVIDAQNALTASGERA